MAANKDTRLQIPEDQAARQLSVKVLEIWQKYFTKIQIFRAMLLLQSCHSVY